MTSTSTPEDWNAKHQNTFGELPYGSNLLSTATRNYASFEPAINQLLEVPFESLAKVLEHRGTARQHDVLPARSINEVSEVVVLTLYNPRRTSMGDAWITSSTISGSGVKKSDEYISGLKKISGARKRSYPISMEYFCAKGPISWGQCTR